MKLDSKLGAISVPGWLLSVPVVVGLLAAIWIAPFTVSSAHKVEGKVPGTGTVRGHYDIRSDKDEAARNFYERKREKLTPGQRSAITARATAAERARTRMSKANPGLELQFSKDTDAPEVVSILSSGQKLTARSGGNRESVLRGFLEDNRDLYGLTARQITELAKVADYDNPAGNLSWVEFEQRINGVPVFQGTILGAMTKDRELFRAIGKLVPGVDYQAATNEKNAVLSAARATNSATGGDEVASAANAVAAGAGTIGVQLDATDLVLKEISDDGTTVIFDRGPFADDIRAELVYFPLEAGNVSLAWSTILWQDNPAYYTILDAETGTLLWRKNITDEQTQPATYGVYEGDNPAPLSPFVGALGTQGVAVARTNVTTIHEHPSNNLGWLTDGTSTTTGNNVDAGLDLVSPNGIDVGSRPVSPTRSFVYEFNPLPGLPGGLGSSNPSDPEFRRGAVTNIFFWSNRYHDRLYELGFTESARNFQQNNFGRNPGGANANAIAGNDLVRAEAQDFSGTNNANFSTGSDGNPGRMQMYLWPNSQRDGDFDNEIVIHELTHGTSNRLHANASGLGNRFGRGMGEGWSDFFARSLLSSADEDVDDIFAMGSYATYLATAGYVNNYYSAIRRFPYAVKTNIGPNGKPHNPLTFADTNPNVIDVSDGAFPRGPFGVGGRAGANAVHNIGEVWNMALLEVRALMIKRLGHAVGNQRMMQIVVDGMKADPVNPTLIAARNSLLAVAAAGHTEEEVKDIWEGFATRGMGFGASHSNVDANGKESFDNPIPGMGDVNVADCNTNNVVEPGESLVLTVPLTNPLGTAINGVSATIGSETADYGSIAPGQTVQRQLSVNVSPSALVGSTLTIDVVVDSSLGQQTKTITLSVGAPPNNVTFSQNFDGVTAPALPAGWAALVNPVGSPVWRTVNTSTQSAPNAAFVEQVATTRLSFLQSPLIPVTSSEARITFRHSYNTEFEWDGGILQISIGGGAFGDILDSGAGAKMIEGGFDFVLISAADGNTNGLSNRPAWTGNSGGFITTTIQLPASAAGQNVQLRWISGSDGAFTPVGSGWTIDNVALLQGYNLPLVATNTSVAPASGQYSDVVNLSATVAANCLDVVGSIEFKVDNVVVGSVSVNGAGTYSLPYTIINAPGSVAISAAFTSSNPYFAGSSGANTLTVGRENATVAFPGTNPISVRVNAAGGTAGPITLCADVSEVPDGSLGNLSNPTTTVSFQFTPVAGGNAPTPGAVSYSGGGVGGTLRACTTVSSVKVDVYDVTVTVNGYYTGTGSTVLAVYDPSLGFVTGGGTVLNNGNLATFGINIKYLRNGRPQGSLLYIERRPDGDVKIKSNSLDSLSIVNNTAVVLTKATLNGVGNHNIRMMVVDNGEPGSSDKVGLQTTNPSGVNIPNLTFALTTIAGGNIQVP